jgi:S1-C subfamily serine protease
MSEIYLAPAPEPVLPPPAPRRRRTVVRTATALGAVAVVTGVALGVGSANGTTSGAASSGTAQTEPVRNGLHGFGAPPEDPYSGGSARVSSAATAAQQVGIVDITSVLGYQDGEAAGTGMVLTSSGEVLTNNHVIAGATSIRVTVVSSGASYAATVVGTDATDDVAVLQLSDASGLATAAIGTDPATVGAAVTGVGNAGGTGVLTAVAGTVTALGQSITATDSTGGSAEQLSGLIETDAAVQPGDSGGPLYDAAGAIIGMDTAASGGGAAQSYAIPISAAVDIATQIEQGGTTATITQGYPAFLGVSLSDSVGGVTVQGVVADGPAAQAGLAAGDVITSVAGRQITSAADVAAALADHSPGDRVPVTWTDATGSSSSATVVLGSGPAR